MAWKDPGQDENAPGIAWRLLRGGSGIHMRNLPLLDQEALRAPRPAPRPSLKRQITIDRKTYTAYDAHRLLENEDPSRHARPGHPLG